MATILVFGSHVDVTRHVELQLARAGYEVLPVLAAEDAVRTLDERHVDVLVLGGPEAWRARDQVFASMVRRAPWALVIRPRHPDEVLARVEQHYSAEHA